MLAFECWVRMMVTGGRAVNGLSRGRFSAVAPECARSRCFLYASRCSLAAAPFPSLPLEERGRERRSSFSASTPDILVRQPAGMSPQTTTSRMVKGLLSPSLYSKGGEGEPLARCSRPPDACKAQRPRAQQAPPRAAHWRIPRRHCLWMLLRPGALRPSRLHLSLPANSG